MNATTTPNATRQNEQTEAPEPDDPANDSMDDKHNSFPDSVKDTHPTVIIAASGDVLRCGYQSPYANAILD